jgi:hypothetical protein
LIGSDSYTQDIGGSCVNLSTPNRTLSEFNYQAIVRTKDPDVANYRLRKTKEFKPTGIEPTNLLEISRAVSALDAALRTQTLQGGLPAGALTAASAQIDSPAQAHRAGCDAQQRRCECRRGRCGEHRRPADRRAQLAADEEHR